MSLSYGQDSTRILAPIPVFGEMDSILRIAVISSSVPHYQLNQEKINAIGASDVGDALKTIPGVQIKDYGGVGGIKTVAFRSLGAAHTGVQLDGFQIPNLQSGVINLSAFELFGMEQIDFSTGQSMDDASVASSYVQANTIAIHSILATMPTKERIGVYSNLTTINAFEHGLYYQKRLGKHFFIGGQGLVHYGSGEYKYAHPELNGDSLLTRVNSSMMDYRFRVLAGYQGKLSKITLGGYYRNNEQELPGASVLFNPSNDQKLWNEDWRMNLNYNYAKGKWKAKVHGNYQSNHTRYLDPHYLNFDGFIDANYQQNNLTSGFIVSRVFRFPNERIFIGSDLTASKLKSNNINIEPNRIQNVNVIGAATVIGRIRLDANLTNQFIIDQFKSGDNLERAVFNRLSPFISIAYLPFKKQALRIRAFYKNTFRMPTFNDLYYNFIGNLNLKPEDANLTNLGFTYGLKKGKWAFESTVDFYYNHVKNKIVAIPTKDLFNWSMQNIGITEIKGVDISALLFLKLNDWKLNINSNHNFNSSLDRTNKLAITYGDQIPYTPAYTSNNGVSIDYKDFIFSANVLYSSYRFSLNENIYANYLPPFTDLNLGISKRFKIQKSDLIISAKMMNILNKNYQIIRSFPMPGRYFQLRINYKITR